MAAQPYTAVEFYRVPQKKRNLLTSSWTNIRFRRTLLNTITWKTLTGVPWMVVMTALRLPCSLPSILFSTPLWPIDQPKVLDASIGYDVNQRRYSYEEKREVLRTRKLNTSRNIWRWWVHGASFRCLSLDICLPIPYAAKWRLWWHQKGRWLAYIQLQVNDVMPSSFHWTQIFGVD